tara:strand:+ start:26 stop:523 length:498 start_codon:yes stop_codon:yes gene_type:complete
MAEITPQNDFVAQEFASPGQTETQISEQMNIHATPLSLPIGIKTPIAEGYSDGLFVMTKDNGSALADNLRNLIQTNHGERLGLYDFGANLQPLLLNNAADFDTKAMGQISTAISKYMPFIKPSAFASFAIEEDTSGQSIGIKLTYTIPGIDTSSRMLELVLKVGI